MPRHVCVFAGYTRHLVAVSQLICHLFERGLTIKEIPVKCPQSKQIHFFKISPLGGRMDHL